MTNKIKISFSIVLILTISLFSSCKKDKDQKTNVKPKYYLLSYDSLEKDNSVGFWGANTYHTNLLAMDEEGNVEELIKDTTLVYGSIIGLGPTNTLYNIIWSRDKKLILRTISNNSNLNMRSTTIDIKPIIPDSDYDLWKNSKLIYNANDQSIYFSFLYNITDPTNIGIYKINPQNGQAVKIFNNIILDFAVNEETNSIYYIPYNHTNVSEYNLNTNTSAIIYQFDQRNYNYYSSVNYCKSDNSLVMTNNGRIYKLDLKTNSLNATSIQRTGYYNSDLRNNANSISESKLNLTSDAVELLFDEYNTASMNHHTIVPKKNILGNSIISYFIYSDK